jgi:DNA repair exonuclease SbcCD ATPase subunit
MMLAPAKGSGFDDATRELLTRLGYKCEPYAVEELKRDYARYEALLSKNAKDAKGTAEMAENKKRLDEFLSKFPTRTDRPLSEIRSMLSALKSEEEAVARKRRDFIDGAGAFSGGALGKADMQDKHEQLLQKIRMLEAGRSIKKQAYELCLNDADRLGYLSAELSYLDLERARCSENLDVIKKTEKYLKEAGERLTARYLGSTKDGFDRYAKAISGKETKTALDTSLTLTHYDGALARSTDSYSRGLRDLYALALRLALTDALFSDEGSFIILDDPFTSFDDEALSRAKATVRALAKERQIIYFTCLSARAITL